MATRIMVGDVRAKLAELDDGSVNCVVTSPPYWGLRDYGVSGQIGLEATPQEFVATMVDVFREVRRVLRDDGTLWLNLGDSYAGSGRGGHISNTSTLQGSTESEQKCRDARGSQLAPGLHAAAAAAGVIGRAWVPAPEGLKQKDLVGIPWRVAFALQDDGWYLRQDIIWSKPNPMPESVTDRCTKSHEYLFLLSKSARYYYDADAIKEPAGEDRGPGVGGWATGDDHSAAGFAVPGAPPSHGDRNKRPSVKKGGFLGKTVDAAQPAFRAVTETRNKRSVWRVSAQAFPEAHFATFPPALIEPCILAGSPRGGVVLDPFGGAGTTGLVADRHGRDALLIELNPQYAAMAERRIKGDSPLFAEVA